MNPFDNDQIDPQKPRFFQTQGGTKFREFGVLEKVERNDWGIHLYNQHGFSVGMKKIYYSWASVYQKAEQLRGSNVVIETGGSASSQDYFRDIYADNPGNPLLKVPEDAGDDSASALVWARVRNEQLAYELASEREQHTELQDRYQQLTRSQREEQDVSTKLLDEVWPEWEAKPQRTFLLVAAAYGGKKKPDKLDKAFALRLGINTMQMKHINVVVRERGRKNNVIVDLPDYGNIRCQLALTKGNREKTKGEWCVQTCLNKGVKGFQAKEDELYGEWRNSREDVEFYIDAHHKLLDAVVSST